MEKFEHGGNIYEAARALDISNEEILDFSANINPLGMPVGLKQAIIDNIDIIQHYPDPDYKVLIEAIADYHKIDKEYIIVGNGAAEIIYVMISALKPKNGLILAPTFSEYERALDRIGCEVEYYYLKEENDFEIEDKLLKAKGEGVDLIVLCNPNNPTGQFIGREKMMNIFKFCREKSIGIILDEAFIDFVDESEKETMLPYIYQYKGLYIIRALTKFFAIPGLRIGYGVTSNTALLKKIKENREPWTINSFGALAGELVLKDRDYIQKTREWITVEREWFYNQLKQISKIKVYRPKANYILFQWLNEERDLKDELLKKKILIRNCGNYKNLGDSFYRVAIKDREKNQIFINALKEVLYES